MAETKQTTYKSVLAWRGSEKLYLDRETADVYFVFNSKSEECEKVPAHKCILSAVSPVFRAMFFGPSRQEGDIEIVDTAPEVFKEFLQFFYRSAVKLTSENIANVMNLGKQYLIDDCVKASSEFCAETLTLSNLCFSYELAILFDLSDLKALCEQQIRENPQEFFGSECFLNCETNMLREMLRSGSLNRDACVTLDGCVAWGKAACKRNGLNENDMKNVRSQLNDLLYDIPFDRMTQKEFHDRYDLYSDLFSLEDFRDIAKMIANKQFFPAKFHRSNSVSVPATGSGAQLPAAVSVPQPSAPELVFEVATVPNNVRRVNEISCYRPTHLSSYVSTMKGVRNTVFRINHRLLLTRLHFRGLRNTQQAKEYPVEIRIFESPGEEYAGRLCAFMKSSLSEVDDRTIDVPTDVLIKKGVMYEINITFPLQNHVTCSAYEIENEINMGNGIFVTFQAEYIQWLSSSHFELVTCLDFKRM